MGQYFLLRSDWAGVSLERDTDHVPRDGRFHIVVDGQIAKSVKSKSAAMKAYRAAIQATGKQPPVREEAETLDAVQVARKEADAAQFYEAVMFWDGSHSYSRGEKRRGIKT